MNIHNNHGTEGIERIRSVTYFSVQFKTCQWLLTKTVIIHKFSRSRTNNSNISHNVNNHNNDYRLTNLEFFGLFCRFLLLNTILLVSFNYIQYYRHVFLKYWINFVHKCVSLVDQTVLYYYFKPLRNDDSFNWKIRFQEKRKWVYL